MGTPRASAPGTWWHSSLVTSAVISAVNNWHVWHDGCSNPTKLSPRSGGFVMHLRSPVVSLFTLGLFGLAALSARPAAADSSCASDSDCVKGWLCQVTGSTGCGYACAPGQDCPPPPDCPTQDYKSCVP